jgi:cyanophycin synthetase
VRIYSMQTFSGRNIYSHRPVIKMVLNIGDLHEVSTRELPDFNERLLADFPGLAGHSCSRGYEGGFAERLSEGTYVGHVTEHLILELQKMMGYEVKYGKTRIVSEPSLYYLVFEYQNEKCALECARTAVEIISALAEQRTVAVKEMLQNIRRLAIESELGPSAKAIYNEAIRRGIPASRIGMESLIRLGYGKYARLVAASMTDAASCISVDMAGNKHLTKQLLEGLMIPVPYGDIACSEDAAVAIARNLGSPVVVKPFDGNQGKGVSINLREEAHIRQAYREAMKHSRAVLVERYIKGRDYRVLVVGGKVSAVAERRPPYVCGDGIHTVRELVERENRNPARGGDHEKPLTCIKLDNVALQLLAQTGRDENYIPVPGETLSLRDNGNISTGGTARECTAEIHPYNAHMAIQAAKAVGLDVAGIDIAAEDISIPVNQCGGAVIEVNAAPGLRMHLYPTEGRPVNVAADIVDMLFPAGQPCSIPILSITGTNGKTTTTRLIRHTFAQMGRKVGMTSTSGVYIGNDCILKGDNTGPVSAGMVLSNREVEVAVLETARGGMVRKGLGYDLADVGVIVNVSDDHLGLDGINSLEDLAFVKALVIEAVKPEGYAVLNADDETVNYLLQRVKSKVLLFSRNNNNLLVMEHIRAGGKAVFLDRNNLMLQDHLHRVKLMELEEIPITYGGLVECNTENSLAAIAALYAMDVPPEAIRNGLMSFKPDAMTNPGRFNLFDLGDFKVMLDYCHNIAGYHAVTKFIKRMNATRLVGVIGMPGDRMDRNIQHVGEISAGVFSRIYIKEDDDLRGREAGEVAEILQDAILKSGFKKENASIIHSETKALETAILDAQPGDLIIMFYEEFEPVFELVNRFRQELEKNVTLPAVSIGETVI